MDRQSLRSRLVAVAGNLVVIVIGGRWMVLVYASNSDLDSVRVGFDWVELDWIELLSLFVLNARLNYLFRRLIEAHVEWLSRKPVIWVGESNKVSRYCFRLSISQQVEHNNCSSVAVELLKSTRAQLKHTHTNKPPSSSLAAVSHIGTSAYAPEAYRF